MYCMCDGHGGIAAAKYVRRHLWREIAGLLPRTPLPESDNDDFKVFSMNVRQAVIRGFRRIDEQFRREISDDISVPGLLLKDVKDIASFLLQKFRQRAKKPTISPALFRQAIVPTTGVRLTLGSDGLWDSLPWEEATRIARKTPIAQAAAALVNESHRRCDGAPSEDASALVLDILPQRRGDFSRVVKDRHEREGRRWRWCLPTGLATRVFGGGRRVTHDETLDKIQIVATMDGLDIRRPTEDRRKLRTRSIALKTVKHSDAVRSRSPSPSPTIDRRPGRESASSFETRRLSGPASIDLYKRSEKRYISCQLTRSRRQHHDSASSPPTSQESIDSDPRCSSPAPQSPCFQERQLSPTRSSNRTLLSIALKASSDGARPSMLYNSPVAACRGPIRHHQGGAHIEMNWDKKTTVSYQLGAIVKKLSHELGPNFGNQPNSGSHPKMARCCGREAGEVC
eukprot:evm.model.scf_1398.3 EVM.evm.TU.scf_1398.3   scf_1398:27316-31874(+)